MKQEYITVQRWQKKSKNLRGYWVKIAEFKIKNGKRVKDK
jgi:hypothetical protein